MAKCEDYPCCGHVGDEGPCPDFDEETGEQLNMKCVCGAVLPIHSRSSLCRSCLHDPDCHGCMECDPPEPDFDGNEDYYAENDDPDFPDEAPWNGRYRE